MNNDNEVTLDLYYVRGTERAYCFSRTQKGVETPAVHFWLPKSQIHTSIKYPAQANKYQLWTITIPAWLAEEKEL